jgi:Enoyl-(Acyl carrier protein) reductase
MSSVPGVLTSLTKGALNAATRALAIEHAKNGVRVNAVSAGIIKTPMHSPEIHPFFASLHPMGRMGEISEIVNAILYLDSAGFVTGEILHVDGGPICGIDFEISLRQRSTLRNRKRGGAILTHDTPILTIGCYNLSG